MDNRFGAKDFFLMLLVLGVGVAVFLSMYQEDRRWEEIRTLNARVNEQTQILASINRRLESGLVVSNAPSQAGASSAGTAPARTERDESWARPGVPVTWPEPWEPVSDPRVFEDFASGGTLTEIFEGTPQKLTPYVYNDVYYARIVEEAVTEQLAMFDSATLEKKGVLAEAWQYDPNGMWLRVKIRDNARFSDGVPVTAEDVRWTVMDYVFNAELQADMFRSVMNVIKEVEVISEKVCEFRFHEPFFSNLTQALRNPILPKHFYSKFTAAQINEATGLLMGSGPYRFEKLSLEDQWKPPDDVVLVRNEQYWGRRPPPDRLRYSFISDNIARLTAFENGQGDIMRATPDQYRRKSEDPRFMERARPMAWTHMRSGYAFISWNAGERNGRPTPFADRRVRLAMTLSIDRERVNRDFYAGLGTVATGPFPPSQADPSIEPWPYDLEKAKALLAEAGWIDRDADGILENERGDEFEYEFLYSTGSTIGTPLSKYLVDQGARLGIRCKVRVVDWSAMEPIRNARDFDALTMAWSWSEPESDPNQIFHSSQIANQGDNWGQWNNPEADRLIELGRRTINDQERMQVWHQFHAVCHEEQPYTFLLEIPWIRFVSRRIHNVHPYPVSWDRREFFIPAELQ